MKIYTCCKQNKTLESFGVHKSKKDSLNTHCKDCSKFNSKTYRGGQDNIRKGNKIICPNTMLSPAKLSIS